MTVEERVQALRERLKEHMLHARKCADAGIYGWRTRELDSEFKIKVLDMHIAGGGLHPCQQYCKACGLQGLDQKPVESPCWHVKDLLAMYEAEEGLM